MAQKSKGPPLPDRRAADLPQRRAIVAPLGLIPLEDALALYGWTPATMESKVRRGHAPAHVRFGHNIYFWVEELRTDAKARTEEPRITPPKDFL